jgi:hypothetical protein
MSSQVWRIHTKSIRMMISIIGLSFICILPKANSGVPSASDHVTDGVLVESTTEFLTKSVRGASQVAVCNGKPGINILNCKIGENSAQLSRSIFSMAALGWRLIAVFYDPDSKVAYYYFSI